MDNYNEQLERTPAALAEMLAIAQNMVKISNESFKKQDENYLEKAKEQDKVINSLSREIEQIALNILELRTPMATDRRMIMASWKICSHIENIGELSRKIVKKMLQPSITLGNKGASIFDDISEEIVLMLEDMITVLQNGDVDLAIEILHKDDIIDELYHQVFDVLCEAIKADYQNTRAYLHVISAAKNYERIADYIVKISALMVYTYKGDMYYDL